MNILLRTSLFLLISTALLGISSAQEENPVSISIEAFLVSEVTNAQGDKEEQFIPASTARPGQVVEYRLVAANVGNVTLPAGTIVITGPIPEGTTYLQDSATPSSSLLLTEFSADGNETFSEPPVIVTVTAADGSTEQRTAEPSQYTAARWTVLQPLEPEAQVEFSYRVTVK